MIISKSFLTVATLIASIAVKAQQIPQPIQSAQPFQTPVQSAPANVAPCGKQPPPAPRKPSWLQQKTQAIACAHNKNLCGMPSSLNDATGATLNPQPCPVPIPNSPTTKPVPLSTEKIPAPTSPAAATPAKPAFVCPPRSNLITGYAYCVYPDHTTVDAIPLPASLSIPAPPASAATGPAQH
jgi:hypothetical protein